MDSGRKPERSFQLPSIVHYKESIQLMSSQKLHLCAVALATGLSGCIGGGPAGVEAPSIDPATAVSSALEMYDENADKALAGEELDRVPGIAMFLEHYDTDGDKRVSEQELSARFKQLFGAVGFVKFNCAVMLNNRPLEGAEIVFEPEPFMGEGFKAATGTTTYNGSTKMAVPNDQLPEPNRALGGGLYSGLYKVTVTHPSAKIPPAYEGDNTVLGWEVSGLTNIGSNATFRLDSKGTKPY